MTVTRLPLTQKDAVSTTREKRGRVESGGKIAEPIGVKDGVGEVVLQESPVKAPADGKKRLDYPDRQLKGYKTR